MKELHKKYIFFLQKYKRVRCFKGKPFVSIHENILNISTDRELRCLTSCISFGIFSQFNVL